jgi:hypothetical protein
MRARSFNRVAALALVCADIGYSGLATGCTREAGADERAAVRVASTQLRLRTQTEPVTAPLQRRDQPELELEARLTEVPRSATLSLSCTWRDPDGKTAHVNSWHTRVITHEPWPTHCRHRFQADDPSGTWTVVMTLDQRELGHAEFALQ